MRLGVLLDSALTFAPHARRLSCKSFCYLRQMTIVRRSFTEDAAKSIVHAFITSRIDNSGLHNVSVVHTTQMQNSTNHTSRRSTVSHDSQLLFRINCIGCLFSKYTVQDVCVCWCKSSSVYLLRCAQFSVFFR